MVELERYGYMASRDAAVRRRALVRAVRAGSNSYRSVYQVLSGRIDRADKGWRERVLRRDRDWLLDRAESRGVSVFSDQ